ncbi:ribosome assembly RNA-binding protein YhbY [Nitrosomonas sp. JL21]|uniref:ribosome assembly RNA-binding protein YhbY n=1 Tax=Nitrosomonas sp. JL21 TaxID=153949 RepID=UPI00136DEDAE|nr:ribosome assembly RNA-binding protein YhbY [Nitrosomonas sp. JL21]MBL8497169.1 ribosome assembly RNA-binding protein YhbY [Nitrosomonas sp.]MCC7092101.1 ribosome assembly RNA-binding protein YhbY [Nitrosomonas sp.]MXS76639.1 ribosome assembly RNA-binding protein YhbY [Nitrosomonas sp. JL21]
MLALSVAQRRELKARAHTLHPIVMIGKTGLSENVIDEVDRGLTSHELIKIKVQIDDRIARNALFEEICQRLDAAAVQHIGKILVIFRPNLEQILKKPSDSVKRKKREPFRTKRSFQN